MVRQRHHTLLCTCLDQRSLLLTNCTSVLQCLSGALEPVQKLCASVLALDPSGTGTALTTAIELITAINEFVETVKERPSLLQKFYECVLTVFLAAIYHLASDAFVGSLLNHYLELCWVVEVTKSTAPTLVTKDHFRPCVSLPGTPA